MSLRWAPEEHREVAYAGKHSIGAVVPVVGGPSDGKVLWHVDLQQGCSDTVADAKRDLRQAWLTWLRERGLTEAS